MGDSYVVRLEEKLSDAEDEASTWRSAYEAKAKALNRALARVAKLEAVAGAAKHLLAEVDIDCPICFEEAGHIPGHACADADQALAALDAEQAGEVEDLFCSGAPLPDCAARHFPTAEEVDADLREIEAALTAHDSALAAGRCPRCGAAVEPSRVVGRCRYAACGHRLGQVSPCDREVE